MPKKGIKTIGAEAADSDPWISNQKNEAIALLASSLF
jgi:hypothetical protein